MKNITLTYTQLGIIADALLNLKGNENYNMEQCQEILDLVVPDCSRTMLDDADGEPNDSMDGDFDSAMASAGFGTDEDYGQYGDSDLGNEF